MNVYTVKIDGILITNLHQTGEMMEALGVRAITVHRWCERCGIEPLRMASGDKFYTDEMLATLLNFRGPRQDLRTPRR